MSADGSAPIDATKRASEARRIETRSPVSGEVIGSFPIADEDAVAEAVARARAALPLWRALPVVERMRRLDGLKPLIEARGEELAKRLSQETGKPWVEALAHEIMLVPIFLDYHRKFAAKVLRRKKAHTPLLLTGKASYIEHFPRGVIGVISPWNFPFQLAIIPMIQALTAGNAVVLKPSEVTPDSGEMIRELFAELDLPEGLVQVVQGEGATGAALCRADVDMIFFTGSVATGRKVMAACAARPIPCELELGGKDAMIVCEDAPLERAVKGAVWGGFANAGQACVSVERLFVVDAIYDRARGGGRRRADDLQGTAGDRRPAHPRGGRRWGPDPHRRRGGGATWALLRADLAHGRDPRDVRVSGGDLRASAAGDPRPRRGGGDPTRERSCLRPQRQRVDPRPQARARDRLASRVRAGDGQRCL
jgi:acyl-CoA reductase-like NAD-dependent aldehyde dehydrogenase